MAVYKKLFFKGARNKEKPLRFMVKAETIGPVSFDFTLFDVKDEAELQKMVVNALISMLPNVGIKIEGEIIDGEDKLDGNDVNNRG